MPNAHTPHSRKLRQDTAAAWIKSEVARGGCRLSLVLPPDAKRQLDRLTSRYGNKKKAICVALDFAEQALRLADRLHGLDGGKLAGPNPSDVSQ